MHRGRLAQTGIYFGKSLRMFVYQSDWKVLPMAAIISAAVVFVVGGNLFVTQEGTVTGSFALVCVCIWNGFFNSIQVVCRERAIVKREHRAGLHMSAYVASHMLYQLLLCVAQVIIMLIICRIAEVKLPAQGIITPWGVVDLGITLLLVTYASDMMALAISCIVRTTTTAMTVMPFMLIFQLLLSGSFFSLSGFAAKLTVLTVSSWGLNSVCAIGRYNEQGMVTLWNTLFKFKDIEYMGYKPLLEVIKEIENEGKVGDFLLWSGSYNTKEIYASTAENVLHSWGAIAVIALVAVLVAVIALEFIDRDKR